jgi:hypothetical protein
MKIRFSSKKKKPNSTFAVGSKHSHLGSLHTVIVLGKEFNVLQIVFRERRKKKGQK